MYISLCSVEESYLSLRHSFSLQSSLSGVHVHSLFILITCMYRYSNQYTAFTFHNEGSQSSGESETINLFTNMLICEENILISRTFNAISCIGMTLTNTITKKFKMEPWHKVDHGKTHFYSFLSLYHRHDMFCSQNYTHSIKLRTEWRIMYLLLLNFQIQSSIHLKSVQIHFFYLVPLFKSNQTKWNDTLTRY